MANEFTITKEIMANAKTYIPIAMKEMIASEMARACVKETYKVRPHADKTPYDGDYGLAPNWCESVSSKARVMMTILLSQYLRVWGDEAAFLCDIGEYDQWAEAHILNQIERFKGSEYREKAFDILSDYREMEKYLNSAVYSVLRELNDPATRIISAIGVMFSAEGLEDAKSKIEEAYKGIAEEMKRQDEIIHGAETEDVPKAGDEVGG